MILLVILFLLGLIVGSFINSFLWRYETKTTFAGRSMCPSCKHTLAWYDNIPVLSWISLAGKCRYCKKGISIQYPMVELLTAVSFAVIGYFSAINPTLNSWLTGSHARLNPNAIILLTLELVITSILLIIGIHDYKTKEIPNGFNLVFIFLALAYLLVAKQSSYNYLQSVSYNFISALTAFLFFYAMVFFSKEKWMGGGDAKMAIGIGLLAGPFGTFIAITIASLVGSMYGIIMLARSKKAYGKKGGKTVRLNTEVPFGPFLALGTYVAMVFGPQIISWYVKIVLGI